MFSAQEPGTFYTVIYPEQEARVYRKVQHNSWKLLVYQNSEHYADWELDLLEPIDYLRGSFS